jgi:hypothetical protein
VTSAKHPSGDRFTPHILIVATSSEGTSGVAG